MELLVKPEMLTSYIYGPTFGRINMISPGDFFMQQYDSCKFTLNKPLHFIQGACVWRPKSLTEEAHLTLRLLMSYIYGAPSKARNANVVYIWTYVWQR